MYTHKMSTIYLWSVYINFIVLQYYFVSKNQVALFLDVQFKYFSYAIVESAEQLFLEHNL